MGSKFQAIFNISVAGGALGLALADSISGGLSGGIGFVIGGLSTFVFFSVLASISDVGKPLTKAEITEIANASVEAAISQKQQQGIQHLQTQRAFPQQELEINT